MTDALQFICCFNQFHELPAGSPKLSRSMEDFRGPEIVDTSDLLN